MEGFSGASGVPKKYVDDLVAQSTATLQNNIIADEVLGGDQTSYTKSFSIPARTTVLILVRCNARTATMQPRITISGSTQTATNLGAAGGSCSCYMVYGTSNVAETVAVTVENYTNGGHYTMFGRISIIELNTY